MRKLAIRRLGYACGAEITGLDLSRPLDDETVAAIRAAWLEHLVLRFPDQELTAASFNEFCGRFGEIDDNKRTSEYRHPEFDTIQVLANKPVVINGKQTGSYLKGDQWHTDLSTTTRPATATILWATDLPDVGGDTMIANQYMAYDTLSPAMQRLLESLSAVHSSAMGVGYKRKSAEEQERSRRLSPPSVHPAVRVHPETGRKALFLGERVSHFAGMTEEESRPLLDFLNGHASRYEFVYRNVWTVHDVLMWDNRCTLHYAVSDYDPSQLRRMLRCALRGEVSGEMYVPDAPPALATAGAG